MSQKSWTVMIYMAGDNNLNIDMVYSLKEIREVVDQNNKKINLLVYYDGSSVNMPTLYCDFTEFNNPIYTPAFRTKKRNQTRRRNLPTVNENSAALYSLTNFVDWCVSEDDNKRGRKADHYAFIVSGHGFGFQNISFLKDDRSNYYMTIPKFRDALKIMKDELLKQPIDVLGFDNCVMSMLEIGNEINENAKIMVASEGSIPNAGWTYGDILGELVSDPGINEGKKLGEKFVRTFIESQKKYAIGGVSVDMSAWDLSKVGEVTKAVNELGEILYKGLKNVDICKALELVLLQTHFKCQSYMFEQNVDLKDFCQILSDTAEFLGEELTISLKEGKFPIKTKLVERCQAVIGAVDECILLSGFSGGMYQYSNGISIFFPWTYLTYNLSQETYEKLQFAKSDGKYWNNFLQIYLGAISLREPNHFTGTVNDTVKFTLPHNGKIADNPANKIADNAANKIADNPANKIADNAANKIADNAANKIADNPANKIADNPANKIVENAANKIADNPANKIVDNAANKLISVLGLTIADFKNIAAPWYVTGYTKEEAKEAKAGVSTDSARTEKPDESI